MMKVKFLFFSVVIIISLAVKSQSTFIFPLDGKPVMNGNYGEVRPNHFHAGIDFKTHYSNHLPIYVVADGYVSRIKISTYGYGKVLYVTHANGLVSVYGHEYAFADKIKKYTENAQEIAQVFEIELFPKPNELLVKQGEIIGYTGNTGGSEGPHLHFELRDEKTEAPYNPLRFLKMEDVIAPKIKRVAVYYNDYSVDKVISIPTKNDTIISDNPIGFGIECFDYERVNGSKNNIYKAEIFVDGKLFYHHILDSIPFDLARYVNTYVDYELKKTKGISIQKLWKGKNDDLPVYKTINNNGFISFADEAFHKVQLIVYDFYNQKDEVTFYVKAKTENSITVRGSRQQNCLEPYKILTENYSVELPAKSLYRDAQLITSYQNSTLSFNASNYAIPFQNNCVIKLKVPEILIKYGNKLCVAEVKGIHKNFVDATFGNNFMKANIRNFGFYKVDVDTIAPQIKFIPHKNNVYKTGSMIAFTVSDNFSGIGLFKLFINGKWHLAEYEHKNNSIFFAIDEKIAEGKVLINLQVSDKKNNQATYQTTLSVE